ncbi:hypothetical protein [Nocardia sp. NPDC004711]
MRELQFVRTGPAAWEDAPAAYAAHTTELVLHRERLTVSEPGD